MKKYFNFSIQWTYKKKTIQKLTKILGNNLTLISS